MQRRKGAESFPSAEVQASQNVNAEVLKEDEKSSEDIGPHEAIKRKRTAHNKATFLLRVLLVAFVVILILVLKNGESVKQALGWRRPDRVALLTVATHLARLSETVDTESEYGASKTAFSYPFSIDNKARYCALHQFDLNVDVHTRTSEEEEEQNFTEESSPRSSRFRKLRLIRRLWDSYDWIIWMDIDALFIDPTIDVLSIIDKNADLHFTLETGSEGVSRVNTGFFIIKTTPFSRDFIDRAWAVNDCGRGESDQRSINFVLGKTNPDDERCTPAAALAEWADVMSRHGEDASSRVKYYKKTLLNAFPRNVAQYLVPVERYQLPLTPGDELPVSLVVHFAGQYGGARSLDGRMTATMLVQYVHMLSRYHGLFLDRLDRMKKQKGVKVGGDGVSPFHDDQKPRLRGPGTHSTLGSGPKTVQDAVAANSGEWTKSLRLIRGKLAEMESILELECLSKLRSYVDVLDPQTGISFKEPPRFPKPSLSLSAAARAQFIDENGAPRADPDRTCDSIDVLSKVRQELAEILPSSPRWPKALLCASPSDSSPLNSSRLWLEMRKPSTLAKLQFGAPFFEDDEYALGGFGWEQFGEVENQESELPIGPSLYATVDVSAPVLYESKEEDPLKERLLLAVAECAFLDSSEGVVLEATFAYSANPEYTAPGRASSSLYHPSSVSSFYRTSGAVVLPPMVGAILGEASIHFWTYTAPLLLLLIKELPSHVKVIVAASDTQRDLIEKALPLLHVAASRIIVSSPIPGSSSRNSLSGIMTLDRRLVYADMLLSLHSSTPMAQVALNQLHRLRSAVTPKHEPYRNPEDDLIVCIQEESSTDEHATHILDWDPVVEALRDALPSDRVVTFRNGFHPDDDATSELFKRAKLIIVAAGIVPSLLLAMFSSEGTPVIELAGKLSLQEEHEDSLGEGRRIFSDAMFEGSRWTQFVASGLGLRHFSVASSSDSRGLSVFAPESVAATALRSLGRAQEAERGDDGYRDETDDHGGRGRILDETLDLVRRFSRGEVAVEQGLDDRDRLGELLQRLGDQNDLFSLGGAGVGVEYGDFSLQILRRWTRCQKWWLVDPFEKAGSSVLGQSDERLLKVREVLHSFISSGVVSFVRQPIVQSDIRETSLSFVYLDGGRSYEQVSADLEAIWPKIAAGGLIAGHDFTRAHSGIAQAVIEWVHSHSLVLFVTDVQRPRTDVLGNILPPCCPSWYFFKPSLDFEKRASIEDEARRITQEMNEETFE